MNHDKLLNIQKQHLAGLLEAIQRCVYFLNASDSTIVWPLTGEQADSFIKVLAIFEKNGVIQSVEDWQVARTARNLAAHDYETDYNEVAEHFNTLHTIKPGLYQTAARFVQYTRQELGVHAASADFASEFAVITAPFTLTP